MRGKYSMKKTILKFSLFACTILLIFADQIEDNKKRIQQIDNQVNKNNQAINKNKSEINIAKKVGTNLIGLSKKEIDSLIKFAEWMTTIQVRLYLPNLLDK